MSTDSASTTSARPERGMLFVTIMAIILFLPALKCFLSCPIDDPDVWWHIKAGEEIVRHGAWPTTDAFSSHGFGNPWTAYSWIPELLLYGLHQAFGLHGVLLYTAGFLVAIIMAFHGLIRRLSPFGSLDMILVAAVTLGLMPLMMPRPWLLSILFFVIELDLLLTADRTGNRRLLFWLVPLFVLWANCHIQFILGLVVLGMAVAEPLLTRFLPERFIEDNSRRNGFRWMLLVFVLCLAATLMNPYHYHLYVVAWQLIGQSKLWSLNEELLAMSFRTPANWAVLATTVAAAFALGWRRKARVLLVMLFVLTVYIGFRSQRDACFVLIAGLSLVAYCTSIPRKTTQATPLATAPRTTVSQAAVLSSRPSRVVFGLVALAVVAGCSMVDGQRLRKQIEKEFPSEAAEFIAAGNYPGPMFNTFDWGGYLIYHLPQYPVSIDGRTMVHGEDRIMRHVKTVHEPEGWRDDPELTGARLVVLPRNVTLTGLLKLSGRYELIHEDPVATVFLSKAQAPTPPNVAAPQNTQSVQADRSSPNCSSHSQSLAMKEEP